MSTVKLQLLLKRAMQPDELRHIEKQLENIGATVTGRGAVTLSTTMPTEHFERAFSRKFEGKSGFTSDLGMGATLTVPSGLRDYVDSISETPPQIKMTD